MSGGRAAPTTREAVSRMAKAELHVHLEGTVDAEGLREALTARGARPPDRLPDLFRHRDFADFLGHFRDILDLLQPPDYGRLASRYLDAAFAQGVRHVELYVSLAGAVRRGHAARAVLEAIREAVDRQHGRLEAAVLVDAVRQFGPEDALLGLKEGLAHRDLALVSGFGMGGDEMSIAAREFRGVYARAREAGLRTTVHAGEAGGADSVREALDELGPDRIAHGIGAAADPALLERLAGERIPLDVCPTSNLRTGVVRRVEEHPLRRLLDAGVRVTLGTDDPGLFGTDLNREYELAARMAELDAVGLEALAADSLAAAFPLPGGG